MRVKEDSIRLTIAKGNDIKGNLIPKSIKVLKYYTDTPNSVGGVDCKIVFKNTSPKTIKYVTFSVSALNAVNDVVTSDIGNEEVKKLSVTGPVKTNNTYGYDNYWECVWYNTTIKRMKIVGIEIEYMDGDKIATTDDKIIKTVL